MPANLHAIPNTVTEIPFQDASVDIWDTKYRLKTKQGDALDLTMDEDLSAGRKGLISSGRG